MKIKKDITMTVHAPSREAEPLSFDERNLLTALFTVLMEMKFDQKEKIAKHRAQGDFHNHKTSEIHSYEN